MRVLNYISVTSAATPISPESPNSSSSSIPDPRQTKILLPKKKPMKWSTGVAPGDYGGPPTTSKLRKYWGGEQDPLASDDFMWNKDFMGRFKRLIEEPNSSIEPNPPQVFNSVLLSAFTFSYKWLSGCLCLVSMFDFIRIMDWFGRFEVLF